MFVGSGSAELQGRVHLGSRNNVFILRLAVENWVSQQVSIVSVDQK